MDRAWEFFDTIADLDKRAATLPKARSWLNYPYFMFARYVHLRPKKESKVFSKTLETWEDRIASDPEAKRALETLDRELRKQLAALLVDVISELETYTKKISRPPKPSLPKRSAGRGC